MFFVYVLKSLRNGKRYIGYTSRDPAVRLAQHNSGSNTFTKQNRPFILIYTEEMQDKSSAIARK